jgi:hypothetical protein
MLSLLRNPEYCVYADATSEVVRSPEEAEQRFSTFSLQVSWPGPRGTLQPLYTLHSRAVACLHRWPSQPCLVW